MTDILIRGMDMPKGNNTISITIFSNGKVSLTYDEKCAEYAEAIPLPEGHGRCIDADELRKAMYHEAFETASPMQKWESGCWIRYKMFERNLEKEGGSE